LFVFLLLRGCACVCVCVCVFFFFLVQSAFTSPYARALSLSLFLSALPFRSRPRVGALRRTVFPRGQHGQEPGRVAAGRLRRGLDRRRAAVKSR
jgi:hypothetical protein